MFRDQTHAYLDRYEIASLCEKLGAQISKSYEGKELVLICVLKGSVIFAADLVRHITIPNRMEFARLSSYGHGTESSGNVKIIKDIEIDISGKHVLLLEDILDTGHTLSFYRAHLAKKNPASIKLCTLLDKPSRRKVEIEADFCGRSIEDRFVVGYGLDFQEKCRNYADIMYVKG